MQGEIGGRMNGRWKHQKKWGDKFLANDNIKQVCSANSDRDNDK